jgi:hypothetical protein
LLGTFAAPGPRPFSWEGWVVPGAHNTCGDGSTHKVYEDMVPVLDFDTPVGVDKSYTTSEVPSVLTVVDDASDYLYLYINNTSVDPVSFGRVKALFK